MPSWDTMGGMRPRRKPQPEPKPAGNPPARQKAAPAVEDEPEEDGCQEDEDGPARGGLKGFVHREMLWLDEFLRRWLLRFLVLGTHLIIALVACYCIVWVVGRGRSYDKVDDIPPRICGLVLGAAPKVDGRDNVFFTSRIQAAADLYQAQKLQYFIVSGDNSRNGYDEPTEMKAALIAKGVPASRIYCDYAGFRTLDSVVRADRIFGQQQLIIISQAFHNPRALYIARRKGLVDAIAFNATGAGSGATAWMYLREIAARVWAIVDVEFLKTQPKFLGEKVWIGEKYPPVDANPVPKR